MIGSSHKSNFLVLRAMYTMYYATARRNKMSFNPKSWLEQNAPGYQELSIEERDAITTFSLLWSLFEAQVLDESASAKEIIEKCRSWEDRGIIIPEFFSDAFSYFKNRYTYQDQLTDQFYNLHLRKNDHPDLVKAMLLQHESTLSEKLAAALIIILRYRNNYFHGIKWAYQFRDQLKNFQISNELLAKVINISRIQSTETR